MLNTDDDILSRENKKPLKPFHHKNCYDRKNGSLWVSYIFYQKYFL